MGTRADFYVGRGRDAEYLGSVTWDGYPAGFPDFLWNATTEDEWRTRVKYEADSRDDWTDASEGWPWPWESSSTTDYAYAFEDGKVYASSFGHAWFVVEPDKENGGEPEDSDGKTATFPDMSSQRLSTEEVLNRSGLIFITNKENME